MYIEIPCTKLTKMPPNRHFWHADVFLFVIYQFHIMWLVSYSIVLSIVSVAIHLWMPSINRLFMPLIQAHTLYSHAESIKVNCWFKDINTKWENYWYVSSTQYVAELLVQLKNTFSNVVREYEKKKKNYDTNNCTTSAVCFAWLFLSIFHPYRFSWYFTVRICLDRFH